MGRMAHTHKLGVEFSREADFVGIQPTLCWREREREGAEGDTGVRGSGEEEGEAVDVKTTTPEERQHSEVLVERIG